MLGNIQLLHKRRKLQVVSAGHAIEIQQGELHCKKQLEEYEEKLGFRRAVKGLCLNFSFMKTSAGKWAESFKTAHPEFAAEINGLAQILQKDYSEETQNALSSPEKVELIYNAAVKQDLKVD